MVDANLRDRIEAIQAEFPRYGYRRLKRHLAREGVIVNEKRIRRVMKEYGLYSDKDLFCLSGGQPLRPCLCREFDEDVKARGGLQQEKASFGLGILTTG